MRSCIVAICCLFSATLFSQNPGVTVQIDLFNPPQETVIATVDFLGSTETESYTIFLNAQIFSTFYFDPQISWSQGLVHIEDCNGDSLFDSFANSDSTDFYYASFFYCESDSIFGCTDPSALNFNSFATIDDGSCVYTEPDNDLCSGAQPLEQGTILIDNSFATQNEGIFGECWNFGSGEGEQSSLWFSFTTPASPAQINIETIGDGSWTLTDTQFGLFTECGGEMIYCDGNSGEGLLSAFEFSCGQLDTNATYILMVDGWNGDAGTCFLNYEVTAPCDEEIFGCTDPTAGNYNPDATIDDGSCEYFDCEDNEVVVLINTENWGYEISWNIRNEAGVEVTGSGDYPNYSTITELACLEDGCYTFELFDSFGDGWNDGSFELILNGITLASGTLEDGEFGSVPFGVNAEGCGEQDSFGCTDPFAINYDPDATIDDGSCIYGCEGNTALLHINTSFEIDSAGYLQYGIGAEYNAYIVTGSATAGQNFVIDICLEDGCYNLYLESWENQSWVGSEIYATTESGDTLFYAAPQIYQELYVYSFGVNEEGCGDPQEVLGCTDPEALNYNPEATVDDGSCNYDFECGISFDVVADSSGGNMFYIIPSDNIVNTSSVLWDFGDGSTSAEFYPTHIYESDGPFTLCLFVSFEDDNGNYCEISYCEVLDGSIFGSGFLSGGFMINVIQPGTLSDNASLAEKEISVYPNPTNDITTISFMSDQSDKLTLRVTDLTGKVIEQKVLSSFVGQQKIQVDLSEFPQGLYLIGLEQSGSRSYAKVVRR